MKKIVSIVFCLIAVNAAVLAQQTPVAVSAIGNEITRAEAESWTKNFQTKHPSETKGNFYGVNTLRKILKADGIAGIYIFNALESDGSTHLIFKPCNDKGELLSDVAYDMGWPCPPACSGGDVASIGAPIDHLKSEQMINKFSAAHPERLTAQLYGKVMLEKLMSVQGTEGIYFGFGLDERNNERLVMLTVDKTATIRWDGMIVDMAMPCPPFCGYKSQETVKK